MSEEMDFELSEETLERVESAFAEGLCRRTEGLAAGETQVLFFDSRAADFATAWQNRFPERRWAFEVTTEGLPLVYHVCMRLQRLGFQAGTLVFATAGAGALFYATASSADRDSPGVVGLLPHDTSSYDFGLTLFHFAPDATLAIACDHTAAESVHQGTRYHGPELLGPLATYLNGPVYASDGPVSFNSDGTAVTPGNIWEGNPATGRASIKYAAPGSDQTQGFPL